jgi:hypothetical protein
VIQDKNSLNTSTPSTRGTLKGLPVAVAVMLATVSALPGCALNWTLGRPSPRIEKTAIPGEETLLHAGEPAPFDGVLIPKGIYKEALPAIDDAYERLWAVPPPNRPVRPSTTGPPK